MATAVTPTNPAATTTTAAKSADASSAASLGDNYNNFLTLLTTQLKHQDPLSPMDTTQFVQQLVSFTQVEQALAGNKKLDKLISLETANQAVGALGYIGQTIEATGDTGVLAGGKAKFTYTLDADAKKSSIVITDEKGKVVYSEPGSNKSGKHDFTWNGKSLDGASMPDGAYKIKVVATDAADKDVTTSTTVIGTVTGIESGDDGAVLTLGPAKIPVGSVVAVQKSQDQAS
jgi:flagellar basal-body rod modification protein FlgD